MRLALGVRSPNPTTIKLPSKKWNRRLGHTEDITVETEEDSLVYTLYERAPEETKFDITS